MPPRRSARHAQSRNGEVPLNRAKMAAAPHTLERAVDAVMRYSPAQPLFRWRASRRLTVLAYHDVRDADSFNRQMRTLRRIAHPVSSDEVCRALGGHGGLPRGAVLVTFDDGDRTILDTARLVLEHLGIPAVAFAVAGVLDTDTPLWWQEVSSLVGGALGRVPPDALIRHLKCAPNADRLNAITCLRRESTVAPARVPQLRRAELALLERAGIEIGNHSLTHACLDRCDNASFEAEIVDAHNALKAALDHEPRLFAYPNGNFDQRAIPLLRRLGYEAAFLFDHRVSRFPPHERFAISRLRVNATDSIDRFRTIVSGLHPAVHHARGLA